MKKILRVVGGGGGEDEPGLHPSADVKRMPAARVSKTRRKASPGDRGTPALKIARSTRSSIACNHKITTNVHLGDENSFNRALVPEGLEDANTNPHWFSYKIEWAASSINTLRETKQQRVSAATESFTSIQLKGVVKSAPKYRISHLPDP